MPKSGIRCKFDANRRYDARTFFDVLKIKEDTGGMKMKHLKRSICLLLCLTMVLSLAACGGDKDKDNKGNSAEGYVYVPTYTKVQGDFPNGVGQ